MSTVPGYCVEAAQVQGVIKVDEGQRHSTLHLSQTFCNPIPPEHVALTKYFLYAALWMIHFSAPQTLALQSSGPAKITRTKKRQRQIVIKENKVEFNHFIVCYYHC